MRNGWLDLPSVAVLLTRLLTTRWADFFGSPLEFWRPLVVNTAYVNYKGERFSFGGPNIVRKPNR